MNAEQVLQKQHFVKKVSCLTNGPSANKQQTLITSSTNIDSAITLILPSPQKIANGAIGNNLCHFQIPDRLACDYPPPDWEAESARTGRAHRHFPHVGFFLDNEKFFLNSEHMMVSLLRMAVGLFSMASAKTQLGFYFAYWASFLQVQ